MVRDNCCDNGCHSCVTRFNRRCDLLVCAEYLVLLDTDFRAIANDVDCLCWNGYRHNYYNAGERISSYVTGMEEHILCIWFVVIYLQCYTVTDHIGYIGGLGVLWHIVWMIVVRTSPDKDRFISKDELRYIQETVSVEKEGKRAIPWKSLLTSRPVYAIVAAQFASNWGYITMLSQMPTFLTGSSFP